MTRERIKLDLLIHDLKVPLAVIEAGIVSLIKRTEKYGPLTEEQVKVLKRALRNTNVTKTIVNDALELGRSRRGVIHANRLKVSNLVEQALVEMFDLTDDKMSDYLRSCTELGQVQNTLEENGIRLSVDESLWCRELLLDAAKLTQILRNLLNNALKYRKQRVDLEISKENDHLVLSVADDGEGIPTCYHKQIFESYFQMDATAIHTVRGHGLGLAGVMVLVEDLGGELHLESDEGLGAKFFVRLPLEHKKQ